MCAGDALRVSSHRVSRLAQLRACWASPLVVCAAGERSYTSHKDRGGAPRAPSPSCTTELTSGRPFSSVELPRVSSPARGIATVPLRGPAHDQLMADIKDCQCGEQLLLLVERVATFNYMNTSAALTKLAKLQPLERWKDDARTHQLVARAGELLGEMEGRPLANSAWACSKPGVTPAWLPQWIELTTPKLGTMTSQGLSNSLYALGGFGYYPGDAWLHAFYTASLDMSEFNAQDLANHLYSLALLNAVPTAIWMEAF